MFSPEVDNAVPDSALAPYVDAVNAQLDSKGQPPLSVEDLVGGYAQLKAFVDLCHLHGIAVIRKWRRSSSNVAPLHFISCAARRRR